MPIDLTPIVKPLNDVAEPVTNSLSDAWSAVIGDRIAAWRLRNAAKLQMRVNDELDRMGVTLNSAKIPERYAFAWFDEATKQDEPEIQELFARLLAKAAAGDKDAADRRNLEILTRMTPMDAKVLQLVFKDFVEDKAPALGREFAIWSVLNKHFGTDAGLSLEHLIHLGVFERIYGMAGNGDSMRWTGIGPGLSLGEIFDHVQAHTDIECSLALSERGQGLVRACAPSTTFTGKSKPSAK